LTFLGKARSQSASNAEELSAGAIVAQCALAAPCVVLGLATPWVLRALQPVGAMTSPACNFTDIFAVPQPQLFVMMAAFVIVLYVLFLKVKTSKIHNFVTWECGYGDLPSRTAIAPDSYVRSIADVFRPILQYRVTSVIRGTDKRHFPELIRIRVKTIPWLTYKVYRPMLAGLHLASRGLIRLQTASIHIHLLYVFATLLILLIVGTQL